MAFLSAELPKSIKKAEIALIDFTAFRDLQQEDFNDKKESLVKGSMTGEQATKALKDWESFCRARV